MSTHCLVSTWRRASSTNFFVYSRRVSLSHSRVSIIPSTFFSLARRKERAISGWSILPAALIRGPIWNPIISAFFSIFHFSRRNFLSPMDREHASWWSQRVVMVRFSQRNGIQSDTVPRAAKSLYSCSIFSMFGLRILLWDWYSSCQYSLMSIPWISFHATPAPASSRNGYWLSCLLGFRIPITSSGIISGTAWWSVTITSIQRLFP